MKFPPILSFTFLPEISLGYTLYECPTKDTLRNIYVLNDILGESF